MLKEVYAAARREKWSDKKVKEMLAEPKKFEIFLKNGFRHTVGNDMPASITVPAVITRQEQDT